LELTRVGVSEGNAGRTLQALRFLNLIDEEGRRTTTFERLRRATTGEYPEVLGEIVKAAYHAVFQILYPAEASDMEIQDAFRHYQPQAQRTRMVPLFTGLCREAGLIPGGPVETRKRTPTTRRASNPVKPMTTPLALLPSSLDESPDRGDEEATTSVLIPTYAPVPPSKPEYVLLEGLLRQLPKDGQWTSQHRERWLNALTANVDLLIEVTDGGD
jgi:hypothetical protein